MPKSPIDVALLTASADSFAAALDNFLLKEQKYIEYLRSRQRFYFVTAFVEKFINVTPTLPEVEVAEEPSGGIPSIRRGRGRQKQPQQQPVTAPVPAPSPAPAPAPTPAPAPQPQQGPSFPRIPVPQIPPIPIPRLPDLEPGFATGLQQGAETTLSALAALGGFAFSILFGREFAYAKGGTTPGTLVSYPEGGFVKKPVLTRINPSGEPTIIIPAPQIGDIIKDSFSMVGSLMVGVTDSLLEYLPAGESTASVLLGFQSLRRTFGSTKMPSPIPGGTGMLVKLDRSQLGIANFIETLNIPLPFLQQQPTPPPGPVIQGDSADFWTLAAIASLEGVTPQGEADVAQVIYNRVASGVYSVKTIKEAVLSPGQFQPVRESDENLWRAIGDRDTAIAAVASHKGKGIATATQYVDEAAANITNPQLQADAANFVGGRTDFAVPSAANIYPGGIADRTRHGHLFGWYVGPGSISYGRTNPGPARIPPSFSNLVASARPPGQGGGLLEMLSRFLPNTGNVIAPRGTEFVGQGTVKQKLLGIDIGETKKTYTQEDINRFNQRSARKLIPTSRWYQGPQGQFDAQATKTVSPQGDAQRSSNARLNQAIQNARDVVNMPGGSQYRGIVESAIDTSIKQQQYYDTLRETMKQTNTSGWDKTMDLRGNEQSRSLTPSKRPEENFTVAYAPVYIPGSVTYVPMSNSKEEDDFDYFDPFGRGVRNSSEGFAIT